MKPIRVLHFPGIMIEGGVESLLMDWYRNIDRTKVQFDFCVIRSIHSSLDYEINALGGKVIYAPPFKHTGLNLITIFASIIKENGPYDAVHIHSTHLGVFALIAAQKAGVKNRIYHVHSTQNLALSKIPFRKVVEWYFGKKIQTISTCKLACSKPAGKFVYGLNAFEVINNAIDLNKFYPNDFATINSARIALNIPSDAIVIGNVARFVAGKNQDFIVKIVAEDKIKGGRLFSLLVGDGVMKRYVEDLAKELNCADRVIFVGRQDNTAYYYNCMDVFCLPSDFEGLGIAAVEAQACGIPCIVSNAVPDEARMGNVSFDKRDLEDDFRKWIEVIYSFEYERNFNKEEIAKILSDKGYNLSNIIDRIQSIYEE